MQQDVLLLFGCKCERRNFSFCFPILKVLVESIRIGLRPVICDMCRGIVTSYERLDIPIPSQIAPIRIIQLELIPVIHASGPYLHQIDTFDVFHRFVNFFTRRLATFLSYRHGFGLALAGLDGARVTAGT